jgi:hypothetical protein
LLKRRNVVVDVALQGIVSGRLLANSATNLCAGVFAVATGRGNVRAACRVMGIRLWPAAAETSAGPAWLELLRPPKRWTPRTANATDPLAEQ